MIRAKSDVDWYCNEQPDVDRSSRKTEFRDNETDQIKRYSIGGKYTDND